MQTYSKQQTIGTYFVNKTLIESIENYFLDDIPSILKWIEDDEDYLDRKKSNLSVTVYDSFGSEKYKTIKDYKLAMFRNDIKGISIEFSENYLEKEITITLRFGSERKSCDLSTNLTDTNPREKVLAIENGLFSVMSQSKNLNWLLYPYELFDTILGLSGILGGIMALDKDYSPKLKFIYGSIFWIAVFYLFIFRYFEPYCTFETNKQKRLDHLFKWLIGGIASFILFSTLATSVRKNIWGF